MIRLLPCYTHSPLMTRSSKSTAQNFSRVLIGLYTVFAIASGFRAVYQIIVKFDVAPLAYSLSAVAALVYLVAVVALRRRSPLAWRITLGVCIFELLGVLIVGTLTFMEPQLFADETVWSLFGQGYGYFPLLLPLLGISWLLRANVRTEYGV